MSNDKLTTGDIADFTWFWGNEFFLETNKGNFVWSDPDYTGGDNTIRPFKGSLQDYCRHCNVDYGRSKGKHFIGSYCGEDVKILDK